MYLILLLFVSAISWAQSPDEPVIRITSTLVQVDAVVTDSHGVAITDLTAGDFEIVENKQTRDISSFSVVLPSSAGLAVGPHPPVLREKVRRTVAIVVDDFGISWESFAWTRRALIDLFEKELAEGDLVVLATTSGGMGIYQQFTNDRRVLQEAARHLRWNARTRVTFSTDPLSPTTAGSDVPAYASPIGPANGPSNMQTINNARLSTQMGDLQAGRDMAATGSQMALRALLRGMKDMPGRKSLVLFSEGMRTFSETVRTGGTGVESFVGSAWVRGLTDEATRGAVSIYPINPAAPDYNYLGVVNGALGNTPESALYALADQTGGLYLGNPSDLKKAVGRVFDDQGSYYLLGFHPPNGAFDGKFHELRVNVKRKGLTVRSRRGYMAREESAVSQPTTSGGQLLRTLLSPFSANGIRTRLTAFFAVNDAGSPYVQAMVFVDANDLTFSLTESGKRETSLEILLADVEEDGQRGASVSQSYRVSLDEATYHAALMGGMTYRFNYPSKKPGGVQVRVALIEKGSGKLGSATQFVHVPALKQGSPAVSGILLTAADAEQSPHPLSTPAARVFPRGSRVAWRAQLMNHLKKDAKSPLVSTVRVLRDGKVLGQAPVTPVPTVAKPGSPEELSGELRLDERLEPGAYFLELELLDGTKSRGLESIDFEIAARNN